MDAERRERAAALDKIIKADIIRDYKEAGEAIGWEAIPEIKRGTSALAGSCQCAPASKSL